MMWDLLIKNADYVSEHQIEHGNIYVKDGKILRIEGTPEHPFNHGKLCTKGSSLRSYVYRADRLKTPLLRTEQGWQSLDWESALDHAAGELARIRDQYGPDSIGVLTSARCTNEENYLLQKLTRCALGTNNIDHCARL